MGTFRCKILLAVLSSAAHLGQSNDRYPVGLKTVGPESLARLRMLVMSANRILSRDSDGAVRSNLRFFADYAAKKWPLRGNTRKQASSTNIANFLSMDTR